MGNNSGATKISGPSGDEGGSDSETLSEVRSLGKNADWATLLSLHEFIAEAVAFASLDATKRGYLFHVVTVEASLAVNANRNALLAALANLLQKTFKLTQTQSEVALDAYAAGTFILIEVANHCGGLPTGNVAKIFASFVYRHRDKSGLGLDLSIARRSNIADDGALTVKDMPGLGCVFTTRLPRPAPT